MLPGFYNANLSRFYPLIERNDLTLPVDALIDFGSTILGDVGYIEGTHSIKLQYVRLVGTVLEFIFGCDAPGLVNKQLIFQRSSTGGLYETQFTREQTKLSLSEVQNAGAPAHAAAEDDPDICTDDTVWEGFLVTGDLAALTAWLVANHNIGAMFLYTGDTLDLVEPARTQNLAEQQIRIVGVANKDRTRSTTADGCRTICWPDALADVQVVHNCVMGHLRWEDGYNLSVQQDDPDNAVIFSASVGGGVGQPVEEIPVYPGELPPNDFTTYSGSRLCCEVVRSINGVGGRFFHMSSGSGVKITDVPEQHRVIVEISMSDMAICPDLPVDPAVECIYPGSDPCVCGPEDMNTFVCPDGSSETTTTTPAP